MMFSFSIMIIISYLLGSIPFGLLLVKHFYKLDIRKVGSGNIGTNNVLRNTSKKLALLTLGCDFFKGVIPVLLFKFIDAQHFEMYMLAGIVATLGHIFPIWLKFKGGKGVATALGASLIFNPWICLLIILTWIVIVWKFKYSSLGSIVAFLLSPIYSIFIDINLVFYYICFMLIIIIRHKSNIINLLKHLETKINF